MQIDKPKYFCSLPTIYILLQVDRLNLSQNDLTEDSFTEEFFELHNLKDLDISHNHLKKLPACICMFLDIERINISGNAFEGGPQAQKDAIIKLFP